jgi:hypothetical protein
MKYYGTRQLRHEAGLRDRDRRLRRQRDLPGRARARAPRGGRAPRLVPRARSRVASERGQEQGLKGVRKAQVKLAAYYLMVGEEDRSAPHPRRHGRRAPRSRLAAIRDELERVETKDFWEIIDRGRNFEFMPLEQRGNDLLLAVGRRRSARSRGQPPEQLRRAQRRRHGVGHRARRGQRDPLRGLANDGLDLLGRFSRPRPRPRRSSPRALAAPMA